MYSLWRTLVFLFPAIILAVLLPLYFVLKRRGEINQSLVVKGLCTLVPIVFCLNGCLLNGYFAFWCMLLGLLFYMIGDIAIEKKLIFGICAFMIGHGLFLTAFLIMCTPNVLYCAVLFILLCSISFILFRKSLLAMKSHAIPYLLYAAVLFSLFSVALNLPFRIGTILMAVATALITISDFLLARSLVPDKKTYSTKKEIPVLILYYLGLYLFALSVWM